MTRGVTRGVVRVGGFVVGAPTSDAGVRDVAIVPHILPVVKAHLKNHTGRGEHVLLFPALKRLSALVSDPGGTVDR